MLVKNQIIEVNIIPKTYAHYKSLGYNPIVGSYLDVKAEDLTKGSNLIVEITCDYCGEIYIKKYQRYIEQNSVIGKDNCRKCLGIKRKESISSKYGVEAMSQLEEVKEKMRNSMLERYGVEYPMQSKYILEKAYDTCTTKYGGHRPSKSKHVSEKTRNTNIKRYGMPTLLNTEMARAKAKNTMIEKYGVEYAIQNPILKNKRIATLLSNGTVSTSKQQIKLYDMIKAEYGEAHLNYPISGCFADIALFTYNSKIDIEYDGAYWHYNRKEDRRRDEVIKSQGWKVLRVKSGKKLPAIEQLGYAIYNLVNTNHTYAEIVLDDWGDGHNEQLSNIANA